MGDDLPGSHINGGGSRREGGWRLVIEAPLKLAEGDSLPEWIPFLPKPGAYRHPAYGVIDLSTERLADFATKLNAGVYQKQLPLDAEHRTKLSGAFGWFSEARVADWGGLEVRVHEWTPRGEQALREGRFKYVSAEYFDEWLDPMSEEVITNVICGGALCTQPFFKEQVLEPLAATEGGVLFAPFGGAEGVRMSDKGDGNDPEATADATAATEDKGNKPSTRAAPKVEAVDPAAFADMQKELTQAQVALAEAKATAEAASKQVVEMQAEARTQRFIAEVTGKSEANGSRWYGEIEENVAVLEALAESKGEDSDEFKGFVTRMRAVASQLQNSELMREQGSGQAVSASAHDQLMEKARAAREANPKLTAAQAFAEVSEANRDLALQAREEVGS